MTKYLSKEMKKHVKNWMGTLGLENKTNRNNKWTLSDHKDRIKMNQDKEEKKSSQNEYRLETPLNQYQKF